MTPKEEGYNKCIDPDCGYNNNWAGIGNKPTHIYKI